MAENSAISWTRHTWNPWMGCTKISPACDGCYAEALMDKRYGKVQWGNAPRVRTGAHTWNDPFRWQRQAEKDGDRPFVFCASLADIFDNQVDPQWRADALDVMRKTPRLVYLLLTKRPQNIVKMVKEVGFMPNNIAFGTTIEDGERARKNLPHLIVAAGLRPLFLFASCEPLLGDLGDLSPWMTGDPHTQRLLEGERFEHGIKIGADGWAKLPAVGWWITGGETDQGSHKARPTHPDWFRNIRDQALAHGLAYHHKQNGEWIPRGPESMGYPIIEGVPRVRLTELGENGSDLAAVGSNHVWMQRAGKKLSGRLLDGIEHSGFPEVA